MPESEDGPTPRDEYLARQHILNVAQQLPEPERQCIELLYESGASINEVALKLDLDAVTVASHCHNARNRLQAILEKGEEGA